MARYHRGTRARDDGLHRCAGRASGSFNHYVELENGWPVYGNGTLNMELSGTPAPQTPRKPDPARRVEASASGVFVKDTGAPALAQQPPRTLMMKWNLRYRLER